MQTKVILVCLAVSTAICNADKSAKDPKCLLPMESGRCLAYFQMYGYDSTKKECVQFVYGGCHGNDNRFETKEDCEKDCKKDCKN